MQGPEEKHAASILVSGASSYVAVPSEHGWRNGLVHHFHIKRGANGKAPCAHQYQSRRPPPAGDGDRSQIGVCSHWSHSPHFVLMSNAQVRSRLTQQEIIADWGRQNVVGVSGMIG